MTLEFPLQRSKRSLGGETSPAIPHPFALTKSIALPAFYSINSSKRDGVDTISQDLATFRVSEQGNLSQIRQAHQQKTQQMELEYRNNPEKLKQREEERKTNKEYVLSVSKSKAAPCSTALADIENLNVEMPWLRAHPARKGYGSADKGSRVQPRQVFADLANGPETKEELEQWYRNSIVEERELKRLQREKQCANYIAQANDELHRCSTDKVHSKDNSTESDLDNSWYSGLLEKIASKHGNL